MKVEPQSSKDPSENDGDQEYRWGKEKDIWVSRQRSWETVVRDDWHDRHVCGTRAVMELLQSIFETVLR